MKMNDQSQNKKIRDIYHNTKTPDTVKDRIEETLTIIRQQGCSDRTAHNALNRQDGPEHTVQFKKSFRKSWSYRRAAAIAAAAILCIGTTVFAAERIYQMRLEKEKEHLASLDISSDNALPDEVAEVEMKINYIPEGFASDPEDVKNSYTSPSRDDVWYYIDEPVLLDTAEPMTESFVKDAETIQVNGRDAIYICNTYTEDTTWKREKIFILYEELDRVLIVGSRGRADKNELIKIAENITLTPTGNMVPAESLSRWSEVAASNEQEEDKGEDMSLEEDDYYFNETDAAGMENVHQIGDKFDICTSLDDSTPISLEVSVADVQAADDLSLLSNKDAIPDDWHELIGPDGKLTSDTLNYIKLGDGEDTLTKLVRTEQMPLKLVYVTAEYTNKSSETIHDVLYFVSLIPIIQDGDVFQVLDRTDDTCDYVENAHQYIGHEMGYMDVFGGQLGVKNYIPEIRPGESATVHLAWLVNEDELDKLYLDFQGNMTFTEDGLETGYVDLNL